jgi:hypothetical protein
MLPLLSGLVFLDGLDWILEQNSQAGIYEGKLDVNRAVSMGYSVGGFYGDDCAMCSAPWENPQRKNWD